ncbi:2-dehydropantoate 2-reductase [bacterium]|nr:2-dehydropantoate 2-reductase [bacterium]MBU1989325.1 2-dehydropantoate 2-reductase [bacterium]
MRIAVVGLGGVGGYLAACLTKTPEEVIGFARGRHLAKIKEDGLRIVEDDTSWNADLRVKELNEAEGHFDIVLFCVKSYDLKDSYEAISENINSNSILVSFSNGVNHGDTLRSLSNASVLDGCIYILSHLQEPGVIRKKGRVFAAVFGGETKAARILKEVFEKADLRSKTPEDIKTALWKKYIFISAFATLTTYYDKSIGYVYEHHFAEAEGVLNEIAEVAKTKAIELFDEVQKSLETAAKVPYDSSTSMHLDFTNKKRDELETLSGYILKEAKKENVQVPLMQKMYGELLKKHRY